MGDDREFIVVSTVQGELTANVIRSHLESEGIPVHIEYDSASKVFGLTVDGLGEMRILVPREFAEDARRIIAPECDISDSGIEY